MEPAADSRQAITLQVERHEGIHILPICCLNMVGFRVPVPKPVEENRVTKNDHSAGSQRFCFFYTLLLQKRSDPFSLVIRQDTQRSHAKDGLRSAAVPHFSFAVNDISNDPLPSAGYQVERW